MAAKAKGESKRGLIVTLVFFVLIIIGLGLSTYYGFADQEKLKAAAKKAKEDADLTSKERDWYRFQIALLLAYLDKAPDANSPIGRELSNKAAFDAGTYPDAKVAGIEAVKQELPATKALVAKLNTRSAWDNAKGAPSENLEAVIKARDTAIEDLKRRRDKADQERVLAQKEKTQIAADRVKDQAAFAASVAKITTDFKEDRDNYAKRIAKLEEDLKNVEDKKDVAFIKPIVEERDRLAKDVKALNDRIKGLDERVKSLSERAASTAASAEEKPLDPTPRGKILRVQTNPRKATIDLGRVHGLTAQTTFSVHGFQPNGKPRTRSKANVEVINVGESTSEVLVTAIFHPDPGTDLTVQGKRKEIDVLSRDNTDPIIAGDALINPLWNPNAKTRIAIAGMIDLTGLGAVSLPSLIQLLEKQNIIVDAYVDPVDGSIKGRGVTRGTDYLLLGAKPAGREGDAVGKAMVASINKLINDAKANGVPFMTPRRFANETGLNLPRTISSD